MVLTLTTANIFFGVRFWFPPVELTTAYSEHNLVADFNALRYPSALTGGRGDSFIQRLHPQTECGLVMIYRRSTAF